MGLLKDKIKEKDFPLAEVLWGSAYLALITLIILL